jgi:hypothetical protein
MSVTYRNALPPGMRINEYQLERVLGAGGFGITYLPRHQCRPRDAGRHQALEWAMALMWAAG